MKRLALFAILAALIIPAGAASAKMCRKCRGMAFIMTVGECTQCGGHSSSGAHKLCAKCSDKSSKCQACAAPLAGGQVIKAPTGPVTVGPPAAAPVKKIDLSKSGKYKSGLWEYWLTVSNPGKPNEKRSGTLRHRGKPLLTSGFNDYYVTPWGKIYWVGIDHGLGDGKGWMPRPSPSVKTIGKELTPPPPIVRLTDADNGRIRDATQGAVIIVRLKGNPTTGYQWTLKDVTGDAVKAEGKVAYEMSGAAGGGVMGAGGSFVLSL